MARKAGKVLSLVARGFDDAVQFPSAHSNHAVRPEKIIHDIGIFFEVLSQFRYGLDVGGTNNWGGFFQFVAGAKGESMLSPLRGVLVPFHRMTKATDFSRSFRAKFFWIYDFSWWKFALVWFSLRGVTRLDMLVAWSMARFTSNAQFTHTCVNRASDRIYSGFHSGGMASAAHNIPNFGSMRHVWRPDKSRVPRNPTLFWNQPGEWEADLHISLVLRGLENLHVMRTGHDSKPDVQPFVHSKLHGAQTQGLHAHPEIRRSLLKAGIVLNRSSTTTSLKICLPALFRDNLGHRSRNTAKPAS